MRITKRIVTAAVVAGAALAVTAPAGAVGDAHERLTASGSDVSAFLYANERPTMRDHGQAVIDASRGNELATLPGAQGNRLIHYVDAVGRGEFGSSDVSGSAFSTSNESFDWGAAAIGASLALVIALMLGAAIAFTRHGDRRPLAR